MTQPEKQTGSSNQLDLFDDVRCPGDTEEIQTGQTDRNRCTDRPETNRTDMPVSVKRLVRGIRTQREDACAQKAEALRLGKKREAKRLQQVIDHLELKIRQAERVGIDADGPTRE